VVSSKILTSSFTEFFTDVEPRLRHALVAALGTERGRDATAEAVGRDAKSWTSSDGITWTEIAYQTPGSNWMWSVTASDLGLVAVGSIENDPARNIKDLPVRLDADGNPIARVDAAVWLQE